MPGANYMGGKRNAARARGKDATGKAQRSYFGKKRFEILRTGLSAGQASAAPVDRAGHGLRGRPEISFAHARRAQDAGRPHGKPMNMVSQLFASPLASTPRRSPPSSASSRSKILRALDAENPLVQRAKLDQILQIPDLLGLSAGRDRSHSQRVYLTPPRSPAHEKDLASMSTSPGMDVSRPSSPVRSFPGDRERDASARPYRAAESSTLRRSSSKSDSIFIPMCLDSSPPPCVHDSGYAGSWPNTPEADVACYEPARAPFYPASPSARLSPVLGGAHDAEGSPWLGSFAVSHQDSGSDLVASTSSHALAGSTCLPLPAMLAQARFLSDIPAMDDTFALSLPPSEPPDRHWSAPTSHLQDSDEIPQASFSLSPPVSLLQSRPGADDWRIPRGEDAAYDTGYVSPDGSVYSLLGDSPDHFELDKLSTSDDTPELLPISLGDLLNGALFEDADPWLALDEFLGLPAPLAPRLTEPDPVGLIRTHDRRGVGYMSPAFPSPRTAVPLQVPVDFMASVEGEPLCGDGGRGAYPGFPQPLLEDPANVSDEVLDSPSSSPIIPQRYVLSDSARALGEEVDNAASPIQEACEDFILAPASLPSSDLEAPLQPSADEDEVEREAQEVTSSEDPSPPPELTVQECRGDSSLAATGVEGAGCNEPVADDGRLLDGPSLFLDDEFSEPEE